jgi:hypothetical protein
LISSLFLLLLLRNSWSWLLIFHLIFPPVHPFNPFFPPHSRARPVRLQHQLGSADGGDRKRVTLTLHVTEPAARAPPSSPTASDWFRPECRRRHDPNPEQENKGPAETGAGTVVSFKCFVLSHPSASTWIRLKPQLSAAIITKHLFFILLVIQIF